MKMEPSFCTAVFWRGGEKIDLNGQKPDAVRCLSVTGERKVNLSFLRDYPNLEELTLMESVRGVEVLSELKQLHTLSLWLSAPVSWDNVSLPGLRVLHLRGEKNGDITPLLTSITYLHLEEMRKTEDLAPFLTPATRLQKLYLQSLPAVQELPALDGLPSLYALKLYELHKLNDLSALSHSHFALLCRLSDCGSALRPGAGRCCDGDSQSGGSRAPAGGSLRAALWRCPKSLCRRWEVRIAAGGNQCFDHMAVAVTSCKGRHIMIKERIPLSGDLKNKVKQLMISLDRVLRSKS